MKLPILITVGSLLLVASLTESRRLIDPTFKKLQNRGAIPPPLEAAPLSQQQAQNPLMAQPNQPPNIALPPEKDDSGPSQPPSSGGDGESNVSIFDVLSKTRSINIFASFTRDVTSVSTRLESQDQKTTLLAPLNSAIQALPRKPWESPDDYESLGETAYDGSSGEDRAAKNLEKFVQAHVIPKSPWKAGEKVKSLGGGEVWWEEKDGKSWIQPGNVEIETVASRVNNGQVWILKGVVNYA